MVTISPPVVLHTGPTLAISCLWTNHSKSWKGIIYTVFQEKHGRTTKKTVGPRDNFSIPPKSTAATVVSSGASNNCQHPVCVGGRLMVKFYKFFGRILMSVFESIWILSPLGFAGKPWLLEHAAASQKQNWYACSMGSFLKSPFGYYYYYYYYYDAAPEKNHRHHSEIKPFRENLGQLNDRASPWS